jgi:ATP-dependent Clp protease ATP-binding subunit ClpA
MASNFDKFTERARKVLSLAQEEAQRFNHPYIGTEHLLLGLVREGEGVAARVLTNMGVQLPKVRSAVEFIIGRGEGAVIGEIGLTPRAKKVIELAVDEARRLDHSYIGTEHLLLGLVREGEGIAAGVLESLGVNLEKVRQQVMLVIEQSPGLAPVRPPERRVSDETADDRDVAMLTIALRLARKREDAKAVAAIRAALESADLRRLVGMRMRARDKLVDAEHRRIELMTKIMNLEREIENYDRQIGRLRIEHAQRPEEDPPDESVGAPR